jgi:hypothetical protein
MRPLHAYCFALGTIRCWGRALIVQIICRIVGHHRSVSCARRIDGMWRSHCKRCGAKLVRVRRSKWRASPKIERASLRSAH